MERLLIVSNRLPVSVERRRKKLTFIPSTGGLATGLASLKHFKKFLWIGWPGVSKERIKGEEKSITRKLRAKGCIPVFLDRRHIDNYYYGFCNKVLWPLFHYFPIYARYQNNYWESYKLVNQIFASTILKILKQDDIVWVQDYHLFLLPKLLKEKRPNTKIAFFLHIPFPSVEIFRLLPWREEILEGILGSDLIGFHTYDYVEHFLESVNQIFGFESVMGEIHQGDRISLVDAFPLGIDFDKYQSLAVSPQTKRELKKLQKRIRGRKVILSVSRLDYTKGILQRLEAYERFLEKHPEARGKVVFILVAVPSRMGVEEYQNLKRKIDETVGHINGRHSSIDWTPVWYMYRSLTPAMLSAYYRISDVALITPLRDGMNLIAKEFVVSKIDKKGVLILSEFAGASRELGEAIIVNPNDRESLADAIKEGLSLPETEQKKRIEVMQNRLKRYDIKRWVRDFMDRLEKIKAIQKSFEIKLLTQTSLKQIKTKYNSAKKRLLLLDYDGTLVPFASKPHEAVPDKELLRILKKLATNPQNKVVIVSGRDRFSLEKWFGRVSVSMVAEHGIWIKENGEKWQTIETLDKHWKEKIKELLEHYVDRTPGSFIEEKEFSLAWHYRNVPQDLAEVRVKELKEALFHLTANLDLSVLDIKKGLEVKNSSINKGRAVSHWLKRRWNFILAMGDDTTDENIFEVLPNTAITIKIGLAISRAKFNIRSFRDARKILRMLLK